MGNHEGFSNPAGLANQSNAKTKKPWNARKNWKNSKRPRKN